MANSVPACSFCHKNLDLPGNKPNSEFPETTVLAVPCGHLFHRTCTLKLFGEKKVAPCKNTSCDENIEKKRLKEVNFETIASPNALSVAELKATVDGYKSSTKTNRSEITKLTNENRRLKEEATIKSAQFKNLEKQNAELVDENKKLQIKNEEFVGKIKKMKSQRSKLENVEKQNSKLVDENKELKTKNELHQSLLESVEKQKLQLINQNKELRNKNDECSETMEKSKIHKSQLENIQKINFQLVNQNKELQNKNDECNETIEKLKPYKSKFEKVERQNLQLINRDKELQTKRKEYHETVSKKLKWYKSELESVKKQKLLLIDQNKELQTKNDECNETMEKLKLDKSQLEDVEKQNLQLINQNGELQTKIDDCNETIENLKRCKSQLEDVGKRNLELIDQNEELRIEIDNCNENIENLKLQISRFENVENQNSLLVNRNKELQTKNEETLDKLQKFIEDARTTNKTSTDYGSVDLQPENDEKISKFEPKIEMDENVETVDENFPRVKINCDDEKFVETLSIDGTVTDHEAITDPSDRAEDSAKFAEPSTSSKSPVLRINEKQDKSESSPSNEIVPRQKNPTEKQISTLPLSSIPQNTSQNHEVTAMKEKKRSEEEESQIRETKKRAWDKVQGPEYDNTLENVTKKHRRNSSSPQQEHLRPFLVTDRRFGPFSQVIYNGEFAYTSGEYLLLGDGIIYLILRAALQGDEYLKRLLKKSPYYFARQSIKELNCRLANLPFLPKKVMISIGDMDSSTSNLSYLEMETALQSLFKTAYQKGVKEIVVIPPIKYSKWSDSRCELEFFLKIKACTAYYWKYYYMQELSEVMSKFRVQVQHYIEDEDIMKLTETITNYTARNSFEVSETEISSLVLQSRS